MDERASKRTEKRLLLMEVVGKFDVADR